MARPQRPTRRTRLSGDDGSLVAELALVAPLLVMLALGVFEFGTAWRNRTILTNSLRGSARIESQGTTLKNIDQVALSSLYAGTSKMTNMTLLRVIVYETTAADGGPPSTCLSQTYTTAGPKGVASTCNVYNASQVATAASSTASDWAPYFASDSCTNAARWDSFYCSGSGTATPRNNTMTNGPDYIGVYAEYTYRMVTGLLPGKTLTFKDQAVYRIEPAV
jgi:Flp pilus assembly protein TadG